MFDTLLAQLQAALLLSVCGLAFLKGERDERLMAGVVLLGLLASAVSQEYVTSTEPLYITLGIDAAFLLFCGVLAIFSRKTWPMATTVLHAVGMVAHVSYIFEIAMSVVVYYSILAVSANGVVLSLLVGVVMSWRERRALASVSAGTPTLSRAD